MTLMMIEEDKRNHKVKCHYGMLDYYNQFIEDNPELKDKISRRMFGTILKDFNSHIRDRMSSRGEEFLMPSRIGKMELRKVKNELRIGDDGEIINTLPVNWKETRKLWKDNPGAKERGIKIRFTNEHTGGYTFKIFYRKSKANYKWKSVFKLQFNRDMKRNLSKAIFAGNIDAFLK